MRARPLQCPFCDNFLRRPVDISFRSMELTGGICTCGSVYVLDRTGHNLGEIFMEALTFVCRGDIDRALALDPGDYDSIDYDYDHHSNMTGGRPKSGKLGKLVFVRLKD
ncbi:MAG: hypothetical protein GXP46_12650 [Deferribacteres bacterium]|nr:hypothetical protein [Deferribacteres bacterium]